MNEQLAKYLADRITKGKLKYDDVVKKYPDCKDIIDSIVLFK